MRKRRRKKVAKAPSLGPTLREIRRESGVSLKAAGPELGVSYTYLSKIENGYVTPSAGFIERLAT